MKIQALERSVLLTCAGNEESAVCLVQGRRWISVSQKPGSLQNKDTSIFEVIFEGCLFAKRELILVLSTLVRKYI